MNQPYRTSSPVLKLVELEPLFEFHPWIEVDEGRKRLVATGQVQEWYDLKKDPDKKAFNVKVYCPKCTFNTLYLVSTSICTGKTVGFCKKISCKEKREHFHVRCAQCSFTTLMAMGDAK